MTIDRKCQIILEKLRLKYINPLEAIQQLKDLYNQLNHQKRRFNRMDNYRQSIDSGLGFKQKPKPPQVYRCIECGITFTKGEQRINLYRCNKCYEEADNGTVL